AVAAATGAIGPPGPVHLNIALREPLVPADDATGFPFPLDGRAGGRPWTVAETAARRLPDGARARLEQATAGVMLAGDLSPQVDGAAVAAFAAARRWPLIAEPHSNARRGPAAISAADAVLRDEAFVAAHEPDVVVVCGRVGLSRAVLGWLGARTCEVIVVDAYGDWWDPTRSADTVVAADRAPLADAGCEPAAAEWAADRTGAGRAGAAAIAAVPDDTTTRTEPRLAPHLV